MVQQRSGESFQSPEEFSNRIDDISGLQLLRAPGDCLESLFKVTRHPDLLWLRCEIYSFSSLPSWIGINNSDCSLPSWITIKNLTVLELVEPEYRPWLMREPIPILGTLWNTESEAPLPLRELNISFDLFQLPKSIEQLKYLEKIELHNFKGTLPEQFFHLRSLKHLRLTAGMKSLPDSLGNFTKLQHIDLTGCKDLQTLPSSFGNLTKLQHVELVGCEKLKMLPESFMNLIRLNHLDLSGCYDLILSDKTLGNISTLERLNFSGCHRLEALPPKSYINSPWKNLFWKKMTGLRGLSKLRDLDMSRCKEIEELPVLGVRELNNLEYLNLQECPISVVQFASVEKVQGGRTLLDCSIDKCMFTLRSLDLSSTRVTEILFGEGVFPVLGKIVLSCCDDLVEVGELPKCLTSLYLRNCCALKKITGLRGLAKLLYLNMAGCHAVKELPGLETLISLKQFSTSECENMKRIGVLAEPANPESDVLKKVIQLMERDMWKEQETFGEYTRRMWKIQKELLKARKI